MGEAEVMREGKGEGRGDKRRGYGDAEVKVMGKVKKKGEGIRGAEGTCIEEGNGEGAGMGKIKGVSIGEGKHKSIILGMPMSRTCMGSGTNK